MQFDENNICEQTYYHWLKRIRQETYELATTSANTACVKTMRNEAAFVEVPLPAINPAMPSENGFRPDITIQTGSVLIGVSNTVSDTMVLPKGKTADGLKYSLAQEGDCTAPFFLP